MRGRGVHACDYDVSNILRVTSTVLKSGADFYNFGWFIILFRFDSSTLYIVPVLHQIRSAFVLDNAGHWGRSLDLETTKLL